MNVERLIYISCGYVVRLYQMLESYGGKVFWPAASQTKQIIYAYFLCFLSGIEKKISMFKLGIINSERWCWEVKAQDEGEVEDLKKDEKEL